MTVVLNKRRSISNSMPIYRIAKARARDLSLLPEIERAAARLLVGKAPEAALDGATSPEDFEVAHRQGQLWVALADGLPVGFAHVKVIEPNVAHLEELDVHPNHGRRGLGRHLVLAILMWAVTEKYESVTLTTFRDVPFNMPFYARLGFEVIPTSETSPAMRSKIEGETRRGLDPFRRVAMRIKL